MDARELMKELADRIETTANVRAVFGEPIGEGVNIIIPVARVMVRGGGGGGNDAGSGIEGETGRRGRGLGMGLGLNIVTSPVGYIRRTPDGPQFVPILDRNRVLMGGLVVAGLALWVVKASIKAARKTVED